MRFVILCSSRGTVARAVFESLKNGTLTAECVGLVADSPDRGCVKLSEEFGIPVKIVPMQRGEPREAYDKKVDAAIRELSSDPALIVACMGWMWMLSSWFVEKRSGRILNVHPALLPKHPGAHAHDLVIAAKEKESGMTIHLIDEGMDTGKILLQKTCPVAPDETVDSLKAKVQALEKEWYPRVLQMIERGEMKLES